jgi:hypothetical protein
MNKTKTGINILLVLALIILGAVAAQAQATRTWVSGVGDDVNPCSRTAPCKTFAGAISKTADGGEIDALDPGGYGAVTITKGITIDGAGTNASILHSATNGVVINAATDKIIILRNLSINGAGTTLGLNGIRYLAGRRLVVQNVILERVSGNGIDAQLTNNGNVDLDDVTVVSAAGVGANFQTTTGAIFVTVNNCKFYGNGTGIKAAQNSHVTVRNSVVSGNMSASSPSGNGIQVAPNGTGSVSVLLENNSVSGCAEGVLVTTSGGSGVSVFISNNQLFNNTNAVDIGASVTVRSFLNNKMAGNTQDVVGPLGSSIGQQ